MTLESLRKEYIEEAALMVSDAEKHRKKLSEIANKIRKLKGDETPIS